MSQEHTQAQKGQNALPGSAFDIFDFVLVELSHQAACMLAVDSALAGLKAQVGWPSKAVVLLSCLFFLGACAMAKIRQSDAAGGTPRSMGGRPAAVRKERLGRAQRSAQFVSVAQLINSTVNYDIYHLGTPTVI